jgi:hypothetical protein
MILLKLNYIKGDIVMFSLFLQYFGLFCLVGLLISIVLIAKENKKMLPTTEELFELEELGLLKTGEKDKKVLRKQTAVLRTYKSFLKELERLNNEKLNSNIEKSASDVVEVNLEDNK